MKNANKFLKAKAHYVVLSFLMLSFGQLKAQISDSLIHYYQSDSTIVVFNDDSSNYNVIDTSYVIKDSLIHYVVMSDSSLYDSTWWNYMNNNQIVFNTDSSNYFINDSIITFNDLFGDFNISVFDTTVKSFEVLIYIQGDTLRFVSNSNFFEIDSMIADVAGYRLGRSSSEGDFMAIILYDQPNAKGRIVAAHQYKINVSQTIASTLAEKNTSDALVYPNPFSNSLTIQNISIQSVMLVDLVGNTYTSRINKGANNMYSLDGMSELPEGVYFLKIESDKGNKVVQVTKRN